MTSNPLLKLLFSCLVCLAFASAAQAETRVLVIGIDYVNAEDERMKLSNPVRDARQIGEAFDKAGVRNVQMVIEPTRETFRSELDRYVGTLGSEDVAVIYYAGHAVQYEGENYIVSSDGTQLINIIDILDRVNDRVRATVFIIDACRNSPYDGIGGTRSVSLEGGEQTRSIATDAIAETGGLGQIGDLRGLSTVVFFSTEPGNVAVDGKAGEGSPFARTLAREVRRRQSLDDLLRRTAIRVNRITDGEQSPWRQGDIPFDIFLAGMRTMVIP